MARPYVLPLLTPILAVAVAVFDSLKPPGLGLPGFPTLSDREQARNLLGLLWQVEGSTLALVTAVVLFAFEALARSRPGLSVWEQGGRSGLAQYLMLGSAGLVSIPVILLWPSKHPPVTATHLVVIISILGIAALPFTVYQATKLIDHGWLRRQRLDDVANTVARLVEEEIVQHAARGYLRDKFSRSNLNFKFRYAKPEGPSLLYAVGDSTVFDINVRGLAAIVSRATGDLEITSSIGDALSARHILLTGQVPKASRRSLVRTFTLVRPLGEYPLDLLLVQLREESAEALKSDSTRGLQDVVDAYAQVLLAWPRAWQAYDDNLGNAEGGGVFRLTPIDRVQTDLYALMLRTAEKGLREHSLLVLDTIARTATEAIEFGANELLRGLCSLIRSPLTFRVPPSEAFALLVQRACSAQVEVARYVAIPQVQDTEDDDVRKLAKDAVEILLQSLAETLKVLVDNGSADAFASLDKDYRKLMQLWALDPDEDIAELILLESQFTDVPAEVTKAVAKVTVPTLNERNELDRARASFRLEVLAWGVRQYPLAGEKTQMHVQLWNMARTFVHQDDLGRSITATLNGRKTLLSDWILNALPSGEAHFIDDRGPILKALALTFLTQASPISVPPGEWLTADTVKTLKASLRELVESPYLDGLGLTAGTKSAALDAVIDAIDTAHADQVHRERVRLIATSLDQEKLAKFRGCLLEAWQGKRALSQLVASTGGSIRTMSSGAWTHNRFGQFGFAHLLPKGMFVSPTTWIGLERTATDLGNALADSELRVLVEEVGSCALAVEARGDLPERLRAALNDLASSKLTASLIIVPLNYRLRRMLGLERSFASPAGQSTHILGSYRECTVLQWHELPANRVYVADLTALLRFEEVPGLPRCDIDEVTETLARDIVRQRGGAGNNVIADEGQVEELRTSVRVTVERPFKVTLDNAQASRSITI